MSKNKLRETLQRISFLQKESWGRGPDWTEDYKVIGDSSNVEEARFIRVGKRRKGFFIAFSDDDCEGVSFLPIYFIQNSNRSVGFETFLESLNPEQQTELLFHLDKLC